MAVLTAILYAQKAGYNMMCQLFLLCVLGYRADPGFIPLTSHQQKTHSVCPFGNNLRTGCSLTRNSYGVTQKMDITIPLVSTTIIYAN